MSREDEAKRDLKRLDEQSEKILGADGGAKPEPEDNIERLGRRIGRVMSAALAMFLIYYLWKMLGG